jgi:WD40 repeat protein
MRKIIREREPVRPSTRLREANSQKVPQTQASTLSKALSTDLDWIVMKCLEKDRRRRYETANGVAMDVERHLRHEPVVARPPSVAYRVQKSFRRNRLMFIAATAVGMALVLGAVLSTWQAVVATRARRDETTARRRADEAAQVARVEKERATASEMAARRHAYASDMNLAQQALAANNLGRARELLYRQRPDLRSWEWRYLWQFCQGDALSKLCQKSNGILSVSVSPDGRWLAIGEDEKGGLSIWDLRIRQETKRLPAGDGPVRAVFSPREPLLAFSSETGVWGTTNYQGAVHLWDVSSAGKQAQIPLDKRCMGLAFSGDGQTLVVSTAGPEGRVSLWRVRNQQRIASYPAPQNWGSGTIKAFAATPDLRLVAVGSNPVRLLDLSAGKERWSVRAQDDTFFSLAFSPDARVLIGAQGIVGTTIHFWDVVSGREIVPPKREHAAWVGQLLFSADGHTLVTASADQTIRVWDASALPDLVPHGRPFRGHRYEVWSLAMLPDQRTVVSGSKDGSVFLWDIAKPQNAHASVTLPIKSFAEIKHQFDFDMPFPWCFAPDSKSIVALDKEFHVARWQGEDFQDKRVLFDVSAIGGEYSCFSNDGRLLAMGSTNGVLRVWDLEGRDPPREFASNTKQLFPVSFLLKSHKLAIFHADDHSLRLLDLATWKETSCSDVSSISDLSTVLAVSPDEGRCILFGPGGASSLIEIANGHSQNPDFNLGQIQNAAFSPDGKLLAAASLKGLVRLWETTTWREVMSLRGVLLGCHSVAFSPDGTRLAMGSNGQEAVKLWDTSTYQELLTLPGSGSVFFPTAFSPDGNVLGSMNQSGLLHLWRAPSWTEIDAAEKTMEEKAR